MNGYGSHTFKMISQDGQPVYCKFHYKVHTMYIANALYGTSITVVSKLNVYTVGNVHVHRLAFHKVC
jgi:hypothetical protein